jgi:hypothetical protein
MVIVIVNPETDEKNVNLGCEATRRRSYPDTLIGTLPLGEECFGKQSEISFIVNNL